LCRRLGRAKAFQPVFAKDINNAQHQGRFRAHDGELNCFTAGEVQQALNIIGSNRHIF